MGQSSFPDSIPNKRNQRRDRIMKEQLSQEAKDALANYRFQRAEETLARN